MSQDVVGQLHGQFAIGQRAIAFFGHAHPRAKMHFVSRNRRVKFVALSPLTHPFGVAPFVGEVPHDGRGARRNFVVEAVRIGLVDRVHVVARANVVLVDGSLAEIGDEGLPRAGTLARVHGMRIEIPAVEVADYRDAVSVRRPHGKVSAAPAIDVDDMRAEFLEQAVVLALVEQVQIVRGQQNGILLLGRQRCHQFVLLMAWMTICPLVIRGT